MINRKSRLFLVFLTTLGGALAFYVYASVHAGTATGKRVAVNGISLYYEEYGAGDPVIFIHGGMGSGGAWKNQVNFFARHYRVILPDSRGQGRSTDSDVPLTYHAMAEDMVALMDQLQIMRAYIVGWSDGGNAGLDMAIHHPDRLKALVAYGANTTPAGLQKHFLDYLNTADVEKMQRDMGGRYRSLSPTPEHLPVMVTKIKTMWLTEPQFTATELAGITVPVLVVDGEDEEIIRPDHAAEIAAAIPKSALVRMSHIGHYAPSGATREWNGLVLDFLERH